MELKDKFDGILVKEVGETGVSHDDVISALMNLGFKQAECQVILRKVGAPEDNFDELLKKSLKELSNS